MKIQLSSSRIMAIGIFLALALALPTVFQGFVVDDPLIISLIEERYPERPHAFDIYSTLLHQTQLFWWTEAEMDIRFFRPIGGGLLRFDHAVFGDWAVGWHLHSLVWLVLFLITLGGFYHRLDPQLGPWILLLFALDESFGHTAGWLANRHALVAMTFGVAALWAHLRWREDDWRPGLPLASLGFVLSLLTAETGLVPLVYVGMYELFAAPGDLRRRALGLLPPLTIGLVYAAWYRVMDYGFHGSPGFYIDPMADPLLFAQEAAGRIPALLGGGILAVPPDLWMAPMFRPALAGIGILAVLLLLTILKIAEGHIPKIWRRHFRWLLPGLLVSCIPLVATFPSHRQMTGPMLGIAPLLVVLLSCVAKVWWPAGGFQRVAGGALGLVLVLAHGVLAPTMKVVAPLQMKMMHDGFVQNLESVPLWDVDEIEEVVVLQGSDGMTVFYGPSFLDEQHAIRRGRWTALSVAQFEHRWTRTGPRSLEVEILGGEMFTMPLESGWPIEKGLEPGRVVTFQGTQIEILEVGEVGPRKLAFELPYSLEDPRLLLLIWDERSFRKFDPLAIGESVNVPYTPGFAVPPGL